MKVLFLDLETTGTAVDADILELGCILYDIVEGKEIERLSYVIHSRRDWIIELDPVVYNMHTKNGLLGECESAPKWFDLQNAERGVILMLHDRDIPMGSIALAGFSVHNDKRWLESSMPRLHRFLSHRIIDASTLRALYKAWIGEPPKGKETHRAIADCEEAIAYVMGYRTIFLGEERFAKQEPQR